MQVVEFEDESAVWRSNFMDFQNWGDVIVASLHKDDYFGEVVHVCAHALLCTRCVLTYRMVFPTESATSATRGFYYPL